MNENIKCFIILYKCDDLTVFKKSEFVHKYVIIWNPGGGFTLTVVLSGRVILVPTKSVGWGSYWFKNVNASSKHNPLTSH